MEVVWASQASEDYDFWLATNAKIAQRIRDLIADIQRDPFRGIGKPEPLRHALKGYWSRRIDAEHRLVYRVTGSPRQLEIAQCRFHSELQSRRSGFYGGSESSQISFPTGAPHSTSGSLVSPTNNSSSE